MVPDLIPPDTSIGPSLETLESQGKQREQVRQAIEHRFRHILRAGQISPLLHLIMRYKLEQQT